MTMTERKNVDISVLIRQVEPVTEAIRQGGLAAMRRHIQAGVPMASYKDGQVIHLSPAELTEMLKAAEGAERSK
jgi:hypothetical protein